MDPLEMERHYSLSSTQESYLNEDPPKYYSETMGQNISCPLQKKRKHTQWVSATIGIQIQQEPPQRP